MVSVFKEGIHTTPEEGHGVPTPPPVTSPATTSKKDTGDALHLEIRPDGTADDQYELLIVIVLTMQGPMMVRLES